MVTQSVKSKSIQGKPISLGKASRKYHIPTTTLRHWAERGELVILKRPEFRGQSMLVDEASIVVARENHRRSWEEGWGGVGGRVSAPSVDVLSKPLPEYSTAELVESYRQHAKSVGFKPLSMTTIFQHLKVFTDKCPTLPLTAQLVEGFIRELPVAPRSKKNYYTSIRAFYNYLADFHNITSPLKKRMAPRVEKRPYIRVLTREEMARVFSSAETFQERAMLMTFYATRVRVGELVSLTSDKVFPDHIIVTGKTGTWEVPIPGELYQTLLMLGQGPLFRDRRGNPITRLGVYERVRKCLKRAGIEGKKLGPHTLRHTSLTHLYEDTGDLPLVQEAAHHADIQMTMVYTHPEQVKQKEKLLQHDPLRRLTGEKQDPTPGKEGSQNDA